MTADVGSLFRFDWGKGREAVRTKLTIPNSIGWSPDNKIMYYTHSTTRTIFAVDYSAADGSLSNERVFYQHPSSGDPDGFRIDTKGNLWSAVYGESRVLKISPEGKLIGNVWLPTRNITCPQFVGTDMYITSAADEGGEGDSLKYGGAVFKVNVGVTGLEPFLFKLAS
jgi:sugar lactone lactonase YvrE